MSRQLNLIYAFVSLLVLLGLILSVPGLAQATATRSIPVTIIPPGGTFTVTVTITITQPITGLALDETLPPGWTLTPVQNDGAIYSSPETAWLWLQVSAGTTKTVTYNVTVPAGEMTGTYSITGVIKSQSPVFQNTISGDGSVTVNSQCTYSISPTSKAFGQSGGTGTVSVTTQSGCSWTATSNSSWITVISGNSGAGSGTVTYSVDACSGSETRTGTLTIAGKTFTVTQTCGCTYTISPTSKTFGQSGGTGTVNATTQSGCRWTATSNSSWITITSGSSGTGNGTVHYSVDANSSISSRTGTMTIAGHTFTVTQAGVSCTYAISPTSKLFGQDGGTGTVNVTTQSGCSWTAQSNSNWITITSGSNGTGSGTVHYSVDANSSISSRTGTMTIAGHTFTVTQDGVSCTYTISPTSKSFGQDGGTGTVSVTTQSGCSWTATSNSNWITITSGSSGTGSGTVSYSVDACSNSGPRAGTMTIAGKTFTVTQACGCTYSISPTSKTFDKPGGIGTVSVTTQSGCSWTATSNSSWITITSGSSETGSGTVSYSVDACSDSGPRTGTLTIAGKTFTVTQNCTSASGGFITDKETLIIPEGGIATLGVKLSAQPLSTTRAKVSWINGDSNITVEGNASLTFDRTNWNTYQYVTLAAAPDADDENGTATIRIHRIAGDPIPYKDITAIEEDQPGNCVTLSRGWNLLSIPVEPDDPSPEAVFDEVSPLYLFSYNGTDYDSFTSGRLTTVEALNGYWLYLSTSTRVCVDGTVLTGSQALHLGRAGWQMIGVPYPVTWGSGTGGSPGPPPPPDSMVWGLRAVFSPMVEASSGSITITKGTQTTTLEDAVTAGWIYDTIWEYDTTSGKYTSATLSRGETLTPWTGYWILTYENNLKLNFSETGGDPGPPPPPPAGMRTGLRVPVRPPSPPALPGALSVEDSLEFTNIPNPITDVHTTTFVVTGPMAVFVEAIKVQIFDLSGRLVYEEEKTGTNMEWHTENQVGETLANGVYLYRMYAKIGGEWIESEVKKLAILR